MKIRLALLALLTLFATDAAFAQAAPVIGNPDHEQLLQAADPRLAANKRLVYDFWREVFEGGHLDLAPKYMTETYIQHNPLVASGRDTFVDFFAKFAKPKPIQPRVQAPLVAIVAEGDLVLMVFARELEDPQDKTKKYTTTWFDMWRIENGKMAEHWDAAEKK